MATVGSLSQYGKIVEFSNIIFDYPEVFFENTPIYIVNATKKTGLANELATLLKRYGFNVPDKHSIFSTHDRYPKTTVLYDPGAGTGILSGSGNTLASTGNTPENTPKNLQSNKTLEALGLFIFNPAIPLTNEKYVSESGEKIEIVIGDDYPALLVK